MDRVIPINSLLFHIDLLLSPLQPSYRYACKVTSKSIGLGIQALLIEGIHFAYSQLRKAAEEFSVIYSIDKNVIDATEKYFDRCIGISAEDVDNFVSDDDSTTEDDADDVVGLPNLNLQISQWPEVCNFTSSRLIYDNMENYTELLLLSCDLSLDAHRQMNSADTETFDNLFDQRAGIFCGLILCFLLDKYDIHLPISTWARSREFFSLVQFIQHSISQGILVYNFFQPCLPNGVMSINQGASLLKEMIAIRSFDVYPVFIENSDNELLLQYHIQDICAWRQQKLALYSVESKSMVVLINQHFVAFINMMNNKINDVYGGSLIIRSRECDKSFINAIAEQMDIDKSSSGSLCIMHL